jgi:hypothetical protein
MCPSKVCGNEEVVSSGYPAWVFRRSVYPNNSVKSRLQLLEHVPVPLILPGQVRQYPMGKGYRNTAMFVQPLHTILAIQTGGSAFKVFSRE